MEKEQKYKKVAELLFGRLIALQREFDNITEAIQESGMRNNMEILIQIDDFIPLTKLAETLEIPNEKKESIMYDEIDDMVKMPENIDSKIEKFFKKYIQKQ